MVPLFAEKSATVVFWFTFKDPDVIEISALEFTAVVEFKFIVPPLTVTPVVFDKDPVTVKVPSETVVAPV